MTKAPWFERRQKAGGRGLPGIGLLLGAWLAALPALGPPGVRAAEVADSLTLTVTPRDDWPPAPVTDLRATPGVEGQVLLEWTAPLEDSGLVLPSLDPVASYQARAATFSAASLGSTTTWLGAAFPLAGAPPPLGPGSLQSMLLSGLDPGATLYFGLRSADENGNASHIDARAAAGTQAFALVFDAVPPAPAALSTTSVADAAISLAWPAVAAADLDLYRLYVDSTAPYDFADAFVIAVDSTSTSASLASLTPGTTYAFRLSAVDKGAPDSLGIALESPPTAALLVRTTRTVLAPLPPFGIGIQVSSTVATLTWMPAPALANGAAFAAPDNPSPAELTGYRVYRATSAVRAAWTQTAALSTATLSWTDNAAADGLYYHVKAENTQDLSAMSMVRSFTGTKAIVVAPDGESSLELSEAVSKVLMGPSALTARGALAADPAAAYRIDAASRAQDLGGRVLKSIEFRAWKGGTRLDPKYELSGLALLKLAYQTQGTLVVPSGLAAPAAVAPTPDQMSVYWFNGQKWVQLYGKVDAANRVMLIETKYLGGYQLRSVERAAGFTFNTAGVSNRFLTPNGDGKNDFAAFTFDNPKDSDVKGRIYDLKGAEVAAMTPGPVANSLLWDGKSGGRAVPGGVYLYQIEAEGQTHNGTLVVIH